MTGTNRFLKLQDHATKIQKFKQGKSLEILGNAINEYNLTAAEFDQVKNGVCAALSAKWLHEKLESAKNPVFSDRYEKKMGSAIHAGRNLETVISNIDKMLSYKTDPTPSKILEQYKLVASKKAPVLQSITKKIKGTERRRNPLTRQMENHPIFKTKVNVAATFAKACTSDYLQQGRGVYIGFSLFSGANFVGGHAVAAYRSRGNNLYFFDPNCGVYNVREQDSFFSTFVACYESGTGFTLDIRETLRDGLTYIDRK